MVSDRGVIDFIEIADPRAKTDALKAVQLCSVEMGRMHELSPLSPVL